jgi:hypothetical protein
LESLKANLLTCLENQRNPPSEKQINQSKKISAKGRELA